MDPDDGGTLEQIARSIEHLEELLAKLPDGLARELRLKIATLRTVLLEQRPPAFALVGRRGAGKSSLINALFGRQVAEVGHVKAQTGRARWFDFRGEGGQMAILDTRGMQEGSPPTEADAAETPMASIVAELSTKCPDAILFVAKASEVDSAIDRDAEALAQILGAVHKAHGVTPPVVAVATHCDLLEPKSAPLAGERSDEVDEKRHHVAQVERLLESKLKSMAALAPHVSTVLGVSTYQSFRKDGTRRADERWRIDDLATALFAHVPSEGRAMFVRVARVRTLQEELSASITRAVATVAGAVAAMPIPLADMIPITALQTMLIASIAWVSGRSLGPKAAGEFLASVGANVGMAFAFREASRALVKYLFPGGGSVVSSTVAFGGTMAVGAAARSYFIRGESMRRARLALHRTG